jgi:SAM-dependent methyltransferase
MRATSAVRRAEHRLFRRLSLDGEVLDVGGVRHAVYPSLIGGKHRITFANIDDRFRPDLVFDAEKRWPVEDATFDAVLVNNVLEHLSRPQRCLSEARRVLKPSGRIIGSVPMLFRIHGGKDFFRFTNQGLEVMLTDAGFTGIRCTPLGSGPFSAAFDLVGLPLRCRLWPLHYAGQFVAEGLDRLCSRLYRETCPLGYFFEAR